MVGAETAFIVHPGVVGFVLLVFLHLASGKASISVQDFETLSPSLNDPSLKLDGWLKVMPLATPGTTCSSTKRSKPSTEVNGLRTVEKDDTASPEARYRNTNSTKPTTPGCTMNAVSA